MLNADHINYQLTAETFCTDPVLSTNTIAFTLCDENGNDIVDESANLIGGDTLFQSHNIKLTAKHIDGRGINGN
jgi:hypothetical protein